MNIWMLILRLPLFLIPQNLLNRSLVKRSGVLALLQMIMATCLAATPIKVKIILSRERIEAYLHLVKPFGEPGLIRFSAWFHSLQRHASGIVPGVALGPFELLPEDPEDVSGHDNSPA